VYEGVFTKLIPDNITVSFAEANFAAVVFCAIVVGIALARVIDREGGEGRSSVMPFLKKLMAVF